MPTLYFDCFSGISGDMTVGALVDAGAEIAQIEAGLQSLGVPGFTVSIEKVVKKGVSATQFHVHEDEQEHHPHRHLHHIVDMINAADGLPEAVKQHAIGTFEVLGEAEATVHGTTIRKVHFHEVGAVDSIVDIVGAAMAMHLLDVEEVVCAPLHVGSGTVQCAHGVMPVPAPATALLLEGIPTYGGAVDGELVTPTGAAIAKHRASEFGPQPNMTVDVIGYGSGTKDLPDRPNVLRAVLGARTDKPAGAERIAIVEANIDDMTGELFPPLAEALLEAGARDVYLTPILGKKGRPAHCVTALCEPANREALAGVLIANSTTLGVRMREESRVVVPREIRAVATPWGNVDVKVGLVNGEPNSAAPEYEQCRTVAAAAGVPVRRVYESALAAANRGEFLNG